MNIFREVSDTLLHRKLFDLLNMLLPEIFFGLESWHLLLGPGMNSVPIFVPMIWSSHTKVACEKFDCEYQVNDFKTAPWRFAIQAKHIMNSAGTWIFFGGGRRSGHVFWVGGKGAKLMQIYGMGNLRDFPVQCIVWVGSFSWPLTSQTLNQNSVKNGKRARDYQWSTYRLIMTIM